MDNKSTQFKTEFAPKKSNYTGGYYNKFKLVLSFRKFDIFWTVKVTIFRKHHLK